jgi:hypothetical protein
MCGGGSDQNDILARSDPAAAMNDGETEKGPAFDGQPGDPSDLFLGHAGVML